MIKDAPISRLEKGILYPLGTYKMDHSRRLSKQALYVRSVGLSFLCNGRGSGPMRESDPFPLHLSP